MKHPLLEKIDFREQNITGITTDSRLVKHGAIFVAIDGVQQNGADFIPSAIDNGATIIVCTRGALQNIPDGYRAKATFIDYENTRQAVSILACEFYRPQPDCIVGVTGTNGKTSVAEFTRQLWAATGLKSASIGTLGVSTGDYVPGESLTTPDAITLHRNLNQLKADNIDHIAIEASSHGLDMHRLDGVKLNAAAFTNLSRDHLDYHQTMQSYRACKFRLFDELLPSSGTAVINADCAEYDALFNTCQDRGIKVLSYGLNRGEIRTISHNVQPHGFSITLDILGQRFEADLPLLGEFQISNLLAAIGLVTACGSKPEMVIPHISRLKGIQGRMQRAGSLKNGATAYIDFAHTPDGLETVLKSARPHTTGKLHVVFGCGGDRDGGKRSLMAQVAEQYADTVIITDDNPRTEDAATIRKQAMQGAQSAKEIAGRDKAIDHALQGLDNDDIVIIAGKGHEQGQIVGTEILPFDDLSVTQTLIEHYNNG